LHNDVLIFKYGLFKTREIILKPYKIQKITISQNYFQKKLGLFDIVIHQLQDQGNVNKLLDKLQIPGLNADGLRQFLEITNFQTEAFSETLFPNMRRLIIHLLFFIGLPSIIFMILKHLQVNSYHTSLLFIYAVVVLFLIFIDYKNYRFSFNEQQIKKQFGIWDVENEIVEIHKVQGIQLQQYFWQKQSNIGSITFFTSGHDVSFKTTAFDKLVKKTNIWLFKIEHSFKKWI
jgi:putative membrane protein